MNIYFVRWFLFLFECQVCRKYDWIDLIDVFLDHNILICLYVKFVFFLQGKIQKAVDELSLYQYSNLPQWVARLDDEVEVRLTKRLEAGIREWTRVLLGEKDTFGVSHSIIRICLFLKNNLIFKSILIY